MNSLVSHLICVLVCILCLPHGGGFYFLVLQLVLFGRANSSERVMVSRAHVMSFNTQGPARLSFCIYTFWFLPIFSLSKTKVCCVCQIKSIF